MAGAARAHRDDPALVSTLWDAAFSRAVAGEVLRDPVAEFRGAVLEVLQVEPAQDRAILGDEHIEGEG